MPLCTIRRATAGDASAILDCLGAAFEPYRKTYTPEAFLDTVLTTDALLKRMRSMALFVAGSASGDIVGTIGCQMLERAEGHIRGMAVLPSWQGSGIAAELLRRAESELSQLGCSWISLDTTEPLRAAIRFYEKHGFRRSGKVSDFFGMPLIEYVKTLT